MATISILPESTAALAAAGAPPRYSEYKECGACLFAWRADKDNHRGRNLKNWKDLLEFWGYKVTVVYCDDMETLAPTRRPSDNKPPIPTKIGRRPVSVCGATNKFKSLLSGGIEPEGGQMATRSKLLIVGYFGHGTKLVTDFDESRKWLYGASGSPNYRYLALSYMQEYARDEVGATDTFFVLETCFGGFDGMPNDELGECLDDTLCETIAADDGDNTIESSSLENCLSSRLVGTLMRNERYGMTAKELFDAVLDETITTAPGFHKSHGITTGSILLAPMRDSPAALMMAGRIDAVLADLQAPRSAPDSLLPRPDHTTAEARFLDTWSDDQKRNVMALHRENVSTDLLMRCSNEMFLEAVQAQGDSAADQLSYVTRNLRDYDRLITLLTRKD